MNKSILSILNWDEKVIEDFSIENSISIANVKYNVSGHLNGKIEATYIIHYTKYNPNNLSEAESTFTGYSIFTGSINDKKGNIVFLESGEHCNGLISNLTIKKNTGTQDLKDLGGSAKYTFENKEVVLTTDF